MWNRAIFWGESANSKRLNNLSRIVWMGWLLTTALVSGSMSFKVPSLRHSIRPRPTVTSPESCESCTIHRLTAFELFSFVNDSSLSWIAPRDRTLTWIESGVESIKNWSSRFKNYLQIVGVRCGGDGSPSSHWGRGLLLLAGYEIGRADFFLCRWRCGGYFLWFLVQEYLLHFARRGHLLLVVTDLRRGGRGWSIRPVSLYRTCFHMPIVAALVVLVRLPSRGQGGLGLLIGLLLLVDVDGVLLRLLLLQVQVHLLLGRLVAIGGGCCRRGRGCVLDLVHPHGGWRKLTVVPTLWRLAPTAAVSNRSPQRIWII